MISKELLSEVLGFDVYECVFGSGQAGNTSKNVINAVRENGTGVIINIHELAHMCKEWAFNSFGISISSGIVEDGKEWWCGIGIDNTIDFYADTEQQSVFEACQWILENKAV
jgi:hypothetical protein